MMRIGILRVELNSPFKLLLRSFPVPLVFVFNEGSGSMTLGQAVIQIDCRLGGCQSFRKCVLGSEEIEPQVAVAVSDARIRQSVVRVFFDSLLEASHPLLTSTQGPPE